MFHEKRNQMDFSFLLLECLYLFEDIKGYENILDFLEKNIQFLQEEEKRKLALKRALFYLINGEIKSFEKEIIANKNINEIELKKIKNEVLISGIDLNEDLKIILKIDGKWFENVNIDKIIENYDKSLGLCDFYEEKFLRNLLEKFLKENSLKIEELNKLTEFLSKIDTYFLSEHNKEVRDMSLKICEIGKIIWDKEIDIGEIERASYFHDLGKISIPWVLLDKKTPLNQKEKEKFEKHSNFSYLIIKNAGLEREAKLALEHHKFINGKGYPRDGETPSFEGNIICLAESFIGAIGLSSKEKVRGKEELLIEFKQLRGIYFYPEVVDALLLM
jgi:HD-GYP domain-containing protein (c-di-GMP phosphodiesterase class II)